MNLGFTGVHRWSADAGGAEHGSGGGTGEGDPTNSAVHLGSEWDFPGFGRNGGGAGTKRRIISGIIVNATFIFSLFYWLLWTFKSFCFWKQDFEGIFVMLVESLNIFAGFYFFFVCLIVWFFFIFFPKQGNTSVYGWGCYIKKKTAEKFT